MEAAIDVLRSPPEIRSADSEKDSEIRGTGAQPGIGHTDEVALSVERDWQQVCESDWTGSMPMTRHRLSSRPIHRRMLGIVAIANRYGRRQISLFS